MTRRIFISFVLFFSAIIVQGCTLSAETDTAAIEARRCASDGECDQGSCVEGFCQESASASDVSSTDMTSGDMTSGDMTSSDMTSAAPMLPPGVEAGAMFTATAPIIDGVEEAAWSAAFPAQPLTLSLIGNLPDSADLSASWRALWDEDTLYVIVHVLDDTKRNNSTEPHHDDSVEVYTDGDNSKGNSYDNADDRSLTFRQDDTMVHEGPDNPTNSGEGVRFVILDTAEGYTLEASIPFTSPPRSSGELLGFEVMVNDDDNNSPDGERDHKLSWKATVDDAWKNPSLMGTLTLLSPP